jgi:hypothetical protein
MARIAVIIHSGNEGLYSAPKYYQQFPWEPSPAGALDLSPSNAEFHAIDASLQQVLDLMVKAGPGGTVLIVCHAYGEGLLMPLTPGAGKRGLPAGKAAISHLLEASEAERGAKQIRAMPAGTNKEKEAKKSAWAKLVKDFNAGAIMGEVTLKELEGLYESWLESVARDEMLLSGGARVLRQLIASMEKVQGMKLARVELRACSLGGFRDSMLMVKKLFGCYRLLAPIVGTFYLEGMPVTGLDIFDRRYVAEHRGGAFQVPGPVGSAAQDRGDFIFNVMKNNPSARIFWDVQFEYSASSHGGARWNAPKVVYTTDLTRGQVVVMIVEEVKEFFYRGSAGTWHEKGPHHAPDSRDMLTFVRDFIWKNSKISSGSLMVSGFWTPGEELPWVLPVEPQYVDHIVEV